MHGLRQCLHQPVIGARAPRVDGHNSRGSKMVAHRFEEFLRGELERHIGLLVGIDTNNIIFLRGGLQVIAAILYDYMQVRFGHVKILPSHVYDCVVDLNSVNRNRPVGGCKFSCGGAATQSDEADPMHLALSKWWFVEIRRNQKIVPVTLRENTVGIVNRMNTYAFIHDQLCFVAHLHHLNIVVDRLLFINQYTTTMATICSFNWTMDLQ